MKGAARFSAFGGIVASVALLGVVGAACDDTSPFSISSAGADGSAGASFIRDGGGPDTGPNLFGDHDGCGTTWQLESHAKLTDDPIARTGSKSCRVCQRPGFQGYRLTVKTSLEDNKNITRDVRLVAVAYVRAADDRPPPDTLHTKLDTFPTLHGSEPPRRFQDPLTNEWQELHITLASSPSSPPVSSVTFDVLASKLSAPLSDAGPDADADAGPDAGAEEPAVEESCFLIDDMTLTNVP